MDRVVLRGTSHRRYDGALSRAWLGLVVVFIAGCGDTTLVQLQAQKVAAVAKPASATPSRELVISAAASTAKTVEAVAAQFTVQTGIKVRVNGGPTNRLASQIMEGAPVDLFLSANRQWADKVKEAGTEQARVELLTNKLVLIVPRGNPAQVKEPADLTGDTVKKLALAGEQVPAGMYATQSLQKMELWDKLQSQNKIARGQDVRETLAFVERGEAEAGVVYASDAQGNVGVEQVYAFDPATHEEIVLVLLLLNADAQPLYDFLQGPVAREAFREAGFLPLERP